MRVETFDTRSFGGNAEHRVFDDFVFDARRTEFATELRVGCNVKSVVACQNDAF